MGKKVALSQNTSLDGVMQTTVEANAVILGVERFGDGTAPLVLLAGGPTMLSWPDALCAALARELDDRPAHLVGIGVGGMVAQVAALDHPDAFSALTLAGTRPVAPGRVDGDLPDHDAATMKRLFSRPMPDWADRAAVAEFAAGGAEILGNDPDAAAATAIPDAAAGEVAAAMLAL